MQTAKAENLEQSIKQNIELAIRKRCSCDFDSSAIYSGEFSCQTTSTEVVYRAIINGTSELLRATELTSFIDDWKRSDGTLLHNKFRLRLAQACSLELRSFSEPECKGDREETDIKDDDYKSRGLLLDPSTCYRFQSCASDGQDDKLGGGDAGSADSEILSVK